MSVRIAVKVADCSNPAFGGSGSVIERIRTFDVEAPDLEKYLRNFHPQREPRGPGTNQHLDAWVVGADVVPPVETP